MKLFDRYQMSARKIVLKPRVVWEDGKMIGIGNVEKEEWRHIPDCKTFRISSYGNIKQNNEDRKITCYEEKKTKYKKLLCQIQYDNGEKKTAKIAPLVNLVFNGEKPSDKHTTDHIDCDSTNNYYKNLRWSTKSEQSRNQRYRSDRKYVGILQRGQSWRADIWFDGKYIPLGSFSTPEEAGQAYNDALIKYGITDRQPNIIPSR
jgi:hypothetical protein